MQTISKILQQFLDEVGRGNPRSAASPVAVIELFEEYLNGWAHEDLTVCERRRFDEEYSDNKRFCDIFDAGRIQPHHLNAMLGNFAVRHGPGTKGFLRAVGPVMEKLAAWLVHKDFWVAKDYAWYRELVGGKPSHQLVGCDEFVQLLWEHAETRPACAPDDLPEGEYMNEEFIIRSVHPGKLQLETLLECKEIMLTLPKALTAKARDDWSVNLELARFRGKWRVLGVGNVYP